MPADRGVVGIVTGDLGTVDWSSAARFRGRAEEREEAGRVSPKGRPAGAAWRLEYGGGRWCAAAATGALVQWGCGTSVPVVGVRWCSAAAWRWVGGGKAG